MKPRLFIDTNVFIFAKEFPESNSAKIIDLLNENQIEAIISETVFKEVYLYFRKNYSKKIADCMRRYLLESCTTISYDQVGKELREYKNKIKDKDLLQIAVTKNLRLKYLVSYDRDFQDFEEYTTPKEFVKEFKLKPSETEY